MLGATNVDFYNGSIENRVLRTLFDDVASEKRHDSLVYVTSVFTDHAVGDSPAISIWLSYADFSLTKHDYKELVTAMANSLWEQRGVKVKALVTVLASAQKSAITRGAALNTLEKLFVEWENEKKSTNDVLAILGLNLAEMKPEDMTEGPLLETWYAFEARRHATDAALLEALQSHLTEEQVASMIFMKTANPHVIDRASGLKVALLQKWLMEGVDKDKAFVRLRLNKAGNKLFTHPALSIWLAYAYDHNSVESRALLTQIVKKYYPDSESLLSMVNRELKKKEMTGANALALTLKRYWTS